MIIGRLKISVQELMQRLSEGEGVEILARIELVRDYRPGCGGVIVVAGAGEADRVEEVFWRLGALEGGMDVGG
jgi:hypothetical protein